MFNYKEVKKTPYSKKELLKLITDVNDYPNFLPWCHSTKITRIINDNNFLANLSIKFSALTFDYLSNVKITDINNGYLIDIEVISKKIKSWKSYWVIKERKNDSIVEFVISFELKSFMMNNVLKLFFNKTVNNLLNAFEERAKILYNK